MVGGAFLARCYIHKPAVQYILCAYLPTDIYECCVSLQKAKKRDPERIQFEVRYCHGMHRLTSQTRLRKIVLNNVTSLLVPS